MGSRECTRMDANGGTEGEASPAVDREMAWAGKAGDSTRRRQDARDCMGKTADAWVNSFLAQRRQDAKNCNDKGLEGSRPGSWRQRR